MEREKRVCLSIWKCDCMLHFLPFLLAEQTKGGKGRQVAQALKQRQKSQAEDMFLLMRGNEMRLLSLVHCTKHQNLARLGQAESVPLNVVHQGI